MAVYVHGKDVAILTVHEVYLTLTLHSNQVPRVREVGTLGGVAACCSCILFPIIHKSIWLAGQPDVSNFLLELADCSV